MAPYLFWHSPVAPGLRLSPGRWGRCSTATGAGIVLGLGIGLGAQAQSMGEVIPPTVPLSAPLTQSPTGAATESLTQPSADPAVSAEAPAANPSTPFNPLPRPNPFDPNPVRPAPFDPDSSRQDFAAYRLGPGDGVVVVVPRFPELSFQATLDLQGNIIVPLEGAVNLRGQTPQQAEATIFAIYNRYVVEPEVSLTLTTLRPVEVTIVGEVPRPGFYPLPAPQLSVALITAGGSTQDADLRVVQVERQVPGGELLTQTVDLFTPLQTGTSLPSLRLQSGDVITVPRLDPSRLDEYDRTLVATSTLAQPEITVRVLNRASGARGTEARFGSLRLPNGSRFLDALSQAGVNPDLAAYNRIAVLRFNPEKGTADTITVDASAAVGGDLAQNIPLRENDVIVVDRNLLANVTYALNTFTQPFRDVLGFLLFFESLSDASESLFGP